MIALSVISTAALVVLAAAAGIVAYWLTRPRLAPETTAELREQRSTDARVDPVLAGPPEVQGDSIRDWLTHYTHGRHSWPEAVAEFYRRAAADPEVASYFHGVDLAVLQRHFTAAITIITSKGLTVRTVVRMAEVHARVTDRAGRPITGAVYDKVVGVLVGVLGDMGVPAHAIADLAGVVAPLRRAIATE